MTVAMRVAGLDRPKMLEQWFRMGEAQNLAEFTSALKMMSVPMWNQNYADSDGHILMVCVGLVPKRKSGDYAYWGKVVPGDTSETLWNDYLSYDELPKSLDPASGWNQNTNEPPWMMTLPRLSGASRYRIVRSKDRLDGRRPRPPNAYITGVAGRPPTDFEISLILDERVR
jgi:acyl-homoserine-lactone acylase